ncbi:amidase [Clostridium sp. 'deep sea']|uniref:amidase family protein n=1 Tax=Clostridium sp. 'deep sea' TaxID=2779445 RepID=UPI001896495B|nr:amidase family protein [Clostridium sp. 'deep sea']QOR36099.1 amidase [Clostridium sp. 'deep sea']
MSIQDRYKSYIQLQIKKQYDNMQKTTCRRKLNTGHLTQQLQTMSNERYLELHSLIIEADIKSLHKHIFEHAFSIKELVIFYLKRILQFNAAINSVLELNPDVIEIAETMDLKLAKGDFKGKLFGIPVLLKDNIGTGDKLHNTAGAKALEYSQCDDDAYIVKRLRESGAIILGKTNLTEWANCMSSNPANGYSALGGQTKNAYGKYDVGGSSAGSAVATSLCLAAFSIGTETEGSILYPANQNAIVGFKLSTGLWSKNRIIPISSRMDTAGPMTRTVYDAAIVIGELVGVDVNDSDTLLVKHSSKDFTQYLVKDGLKGIKIGLVINENLYNLRYGDKEILNRVVSELTMLGAIVKLVTLPSDIKVPEYFNFLMHDFKHGVNKYLKENTRENSDLTLSKIIDYNNIDLANRAVYGQDVLESANKAEFSNSNMETLAKQVQNNSRAILDKCLAENNVDMLLSLSVALSSYYATAGYPAITVPAGFRDNGEPVGITLVAKLFNEDLLLKAAYSYEQGTKHRTKPCVNKLQV